MLILSHMVSVAFTSAHTSFVLLDAWITLHCNMLSPYLQSQPSFVTTVSLSTLYRQTQIILSWFRSHDKKITIGLNLTRCINNSTVEGDTSSISTNWQRDNVCTGVTMLLAIWKVWAAESPRQTSATEKWWDYFKREREGWVKFIYFPSRQCKRHVSENPMWYVKLFFYGSNKQFFTTVFPLFEQWIMCFSLFYSSIEKIPPIKIIPNS